VGLTVPRIRRKAGRCLFGADLDAYDRGRPGHPPRVYELLVERCGFSPGARVLEIGPGTGQATRPLVALGADVTAIEPDPRLAEHLPSAVGPLTVVNQPLETVELPAAAFHLAIAASSFHWVEEDVGLAKLLATLRPGGWIALWWTLFGTEERPNPLHEELTPILDRIYAEHGVEAATSPSTGEGGRPRFALDIDARTAALTEAGFERVEHETIAWSHSWDVDGIRALYASFSPILRLDAATRVAVLDAVADVAQRRFGGEIVFPLLTSLYTACSPSPR
jgi:SAM-dependent methyltransferase